jgi:hypothetical protein
MQLFQRKKMKSSFKGMVETNEKFIDFVAVMESDLDEKYKSNVSLLKDHLTNMNVLFNQMIDSINKLK